MIIAAISGTASASALPIAAGAPIVPPSPIPLTPPGVSGDGVTVSAENIIDVLGEIDAIVVGDVGSGGLADLDTDPLWLRLPAVASGHVRSIPGNSNYGSLFTARFVAGELDGLLSSM